MVDDPTQTPPWRPTEIRLRLARNTTSPNPDFGVKVPLIVNNEVLWRSLEGSDLAVLPAPDLSIYTDLHAVIVSDFGAGEDDVFQGAPVIVLGYPGVIGEAPLSFPIARSGIIAWTDPLDRLGRPFLVDANVMPGNSGGPVFHLRSGLNRFGGFVVGGGLALIGIVSQGPLQNIQIAMPPTLAGPAQMLQFQLNGIGGIGVIEPASKAKRLVQQYCGPS
jgi:trypsin-like peptidase